MKTETVLRKKIRLTLLSFLVLLMLSGITAFPIESELAFLVSMKGYLPDTAEVWVQTIYQAIRQTNHAYPYLSYGTDWLAFAHIVISVAFIGPLKDPVRNIWVIQFGMISCLMVFPLAFIAGYVRHIPFFWQLIDCSFGVFGLILLQLCYRRIKMLENMQATS